MAQEITITKPIATDTWVLQATAPTDALARSIRWKHTPEVLNVDISYTVGGTTRVLESDYSEMTDLGNDIYEYIWEPDDTQRGFLLADGVTGTEVIITIMEHEANGIIDTVTFKCYLKSWGNMQPDGTNQATISRPFLKLDDINIEWQALDHDSDLFDTKIGLKVRVSGGVTWTQIVANYDKALRHYIWNPLAHNSSLFESITATGAYTLRLYSYTEEENYIDKTIYIVNEPSDTTGITPYYDGLADGDDTAYYYNHPSRKDLMARLSLEKGVYVDEAIAIGQLEAGHGIIIEQRLSDGKSRLKPDEKANLAKAYNLVIRVQEDKLVLPREPRTLEGWLKFVDNGTIAQETDTDIMNLGIYYGQLRKIDVTHAWDLGNTVDPYYVQNQNFGSFHCEVTEVSNTDWYPLHRGQKCSQVYWEVLHGNSIRFFCNVKGYSLLSNQSKDQFTSSQSPSAQSMAYNNGEYLSRYIFRYRLVEIITNPA